MAIWKRGIFTIANSGAVQPMIGKRCRWLTKGTAIFSSHEPRGLIVLFI
jgi:hypothetical protein